MSRAAVSLAEDDVAQSAQRNEQIQQGFDSQRFQRTVAQSMGSALAKQAAESAQQQREIARVVGMGAVKYADLSQNRTSGYVFSFDKMLAMQGNTAPYIQYACARTHALLDRADVTGAELETCPPEILFEAPAELTLAKSLLRFRDALEQATATYQPHILTSYLFDVATRFTDFFEKCPVLPSVDPLRASRLALCHLTCRTLKTGLNLLGIETLPRM